jgi:hypothetical protein
VVQDITPPTIACLPNRTIECNAAFNFDPPTASDLCDATPTVTFVDVDNPDGSKTRTWTATDDCGNSASCSQTLFVAPCAHIFPTQTSCCHFTSGTATGLLNVCTTVSGGTGGTGGTVTNAIPGVFFYYSNVIAPAASFTIDVTQINDGNLDELFDIQGFDPNPNKANLSQIRLFTSNCEAVSFTPSFINSGNGARLVVTGATPGATYVISIKYDVKSIIDAVYSGADQTSTYTFKSFTNVGAGNVLVPGSTGTINAVAGCEDNTPLPGNCTLTNGTSAISPVAPIETAKTNSAGFDAYPVPFKDQLTIKYNFDYTSKVKIEVFNAQGNLVLSKTDANGYLNKEIMLDLKVNKGQEQVYIVKLTTDRGSSTKKVMSSR